MAIMNTRLNIEKLDEYIVQKHGGSKQVGFKQLGPRVEIGVHGVHDEKLVWFEVELHGAQGDREAEVFRLVMMTLHWLKDGWRTSNLKRRQTRTTWSTQQCMKSGVVKHLDVAGIEQQNGLVDETNVTLFAKVRSIGFKKPIDMLRFCGWLASIEQGMLESVKVKCIFLGYHESILGNKLWRLDDVTSKVVLYRNMGFNESGEYKKTFIGSSVGTGSMQVLQGVEFEVEPHEDLTFEVEPHGNVDHVDVASVDKIYAHESLTFNDTVACEVISKWKARLKEDMDVRSDVYVLSNGYRKSSDNSYDYYWEYAPAKGNVLGLDIIRDQSGNTLRVSQSRFHNEKLVQTLLKGHYTLLLEDSLSGDCDMENNNKRICFFVDFDYAMGRSITVMSRSITGYGFMILGCAGSLKANLQHMKDLSTTEAGYVTFIEARKKETWLKGLLKESGYELRLVAGIATSALVKGCSRSEVPAQVKVSNDDTTVAQRWLKDKQPEEKQHGRFEVYTTMYEEWGRQTFGCYRDTIRVEEQPCLLSSEQGPSHQAIEAPIDIFGFFCCLGLEKQGCLNRYKVVLYKNMGFNESEEYKKTFIGSGVGTFVVAVVEKIYAHESLTFNDTVAYEHDGMVFSWDARLRSGLPRVCWLKQRENTRLISLGIRVLLSSKGTVMWEKNGKWSCIYAVGSQEYQMVCTRLDIASADVGMLDKFDRGLQTDVQEAESYECKKHERICEQLSGDMTLTGAWKKEIWLKGLLAESGLDAK
ncbi:hypothetical protein Tco_1508022 [Tanacetum coccineum]